MPDYNNTFGSNNANGTLTTTDGGKIRKGPRITIGNWDSGPSCPWFDKQNVTTRAGSTFGIECGVRHRGGNFKVVQPGNFMSCIEMCEKATGCVHVDMVEVNLMISNARMPVRSPTSLGAGLVISVRIAGSENSSMHLDCLLLLQRTILMIRCDGDNHVVDGESREERKRETAVPSIIDATNNQGKR
ncbi:hypothetical protein BDZ85DRAFT_250866 [Elsinoe ampelina]|uniref:Apple domain-containing protein n=1 Tax=Elsinoe ampelina TaxID=302913 RepID=A0A6A6G8E9_9PEZI|nr:hypothetical protein BDZ85DRAFT_250866 [Elsinoe ampelina]